MSSVNRKTKGKTWNSSSDDGSDDDDGDIPKKMKNRSFCKRETEAKMKRTKKVLNKICDEDDSDSEEYKARRPFFLPLASKKNLLLKTNPSSSDDDSTISTKKTKPSKLVDNTTQWKKRKCESSSPDLEHEKRKKKSKKSPKSMLNENPQSKTNIDENSDSSSSKEFRKPKTKSNISSRLSSGSHVHDDYSIITTPSKSDDETIPVDKSHETSLKCQVREEIEKLHKLTEDLKSSFELHSDYLLKKKINVVRDSKFVAHKILRTYDIAYEKLKEHRNNFAETYKNWLSSCSEKKYINPNESIKQKQKKLIDGTTQRRDSLTTTKDSLDVSSSKNNLNLNLENKNTKVKSCKYVDNTSSSSSSDEDFSKKKNKKKKNSHFQETEESATSSHHSSKNDKIEKSEKEKNENKKKTSSPLLKKSSCKSPESKKDESDYENTNKDTESDPKKSDFKDDSDTEKTVKKRLSVQSKEVNKSCNDESGSSFLTAELMDANSELQQSMLNKKDNGNDSEEVSDCDSDDIFSGDETRRLSKKVTKEAGKIQEPNVINESTSKEKTVKDKSYKRSKSPSSDELDSSVSEIANTPVKSPAHCKSLRKTLLRASIPDVLDNDESEIETSGKEIESTIVKNTSNLLENETTMLTTKENENSESGKDLNQSLEDEVDVEGPEDNKSNSSKSEKKTKENKSKTSERNPVHANGNIGNTDSKEVTELSVNNSKQAPHVVDKKKSEESEQIHKTKKNSDSCIAKTVDSDKSKTDGIAKKDSKKTTDSDRSESGSELEKVAENNSKSSVKKKINSDRSESGSGLEEAAEKNYKNSAKKKIDSDRSESGSELEETAKKNSKSNAKKKIDSDRSESGSELEEAAKKNSKNNAKKKIESDRSESRNFEPEKLKSSKTTSKSNARKSSESSSKSNRENSETEVEGANLKKSKTETENEGSDSDEHTDINVVSETENENKTVNSKNSDDDSVRKNSKVEDPVHTVDPEEAAALSNLLRDSDSDESSNGTDSENSSSDVSSEPKKKKTAKSKTITNSFSKTNLKSILSISSDSTSDSEQKANSCKTKKRRLDSDDDDSCDISLKKPKRIAFNIRKNRHYKNDKKLRMECRVVLERLSRRVLKKHAKALEKSKKFLANKKLNSIINLDCLETKKKSKKNLETDNDNVINNKTKKKTKKTSTSESENEDNNGVASDSDHDEVDHESNDDTRMFNDVSHEVEVTDELENEAKQALLKSSSSSSGNESEEQVRDSPPKKPIKIKVKKVSKNSSEMEVMEIQSNDEGSENDQKDKEKNKWKEDKLLTFKITDDEAEEEKLNKSREKKKGKKAVSDEDDSVEEVTMDDKTPTSPPTKKSTRQRKKKRVLDSDSESKIISSDESEAGSEAEEEESKEKKKKTKKRKQKSSDSDSSSNDPKPKAKRKRIKKVADSDSDDDQESPGKSRRKNIRKVLKDKHVADDTKKAAMDEEERLKRIAERQRLFNEMDQVRQAAIDKLDNLVLDIDEESKEELIAVDPELVKRLKPHQAQGIKFMWDACFESLEQIKKSEGSGCIIAHCMGLGKTFQVVTLSHTLLAHEETGVRTVMIVCPLSTVLNWVNEFKMWLKHTKDGDDIEIYEMTKAKKNIERKYLLESWQKTGGVLIMGYEMFRNLTSGTTKKMRKAMQESINRSLVDPGADLVVCDEGHLLKNEDSALSKAMKLVKTKRRIVLTGTPLQNNLKEYHCMIQFVKPSLLGTRKEFLNRFVNPITNGQFDDSTPQDVKLMKKRAHVLHKMLEGSVQRFDYSVLTPFLPPKQEYVIFVRLHDVQIKMYQHYLDNFARRYGGKNGSLFADFQELQRIWTHPYVLRLNAAKVDKANEKKRLEASDSEGSLVDFIDDDDGSDSSSVKSSSSSNSNSDVQCIDSDDEKPASRARSTRLNPKDEPPVEEAPNVTTEEAAWWSQYLEESHFQDLRISSKLQLLFGIIKESEQIGDKVLVFSQSLYSLTLIEYFLNLIDNETQKDDDDDEGAEYLDGHSGKWQLGLDYFRLDGSTSAENRSIWCKIFNNPKNTRARLFLISTRAGGLGINLTAANRVIIFDASWNPSHDVQSIFRIYRFGQKKPCYVYRFLAAGTMEEKIYNRQVTKLSLACRVVDEQQIERHYSNNDLAELYQFETYENKTNTLGLPKDRLLAEIFLKYKDRVWTYHEHDSLLENKAEEELDEEERKQAWLEYEEEKQGKRQMINTGNNMLYNQMLMNMNASFPEMDSIKLLIQKDYPNLPPEHLETVARQAMYDMYRYVDQQVVNQMNPYGMYGGSMTQVNQQPQFNQQQNTHNAQNSLMNLQQQMNYAAGVTNHMPVYSGRGRPPKHLAMQNQMMMNQPINMNNMNSMSNINNMNNMNSMNSLNNLSLNPLASLLQQSNRGQQLPQMSNNTNNDDIEVISDGSAIPPDPLATNNVQEK